MKRDLALIYSRLSRRGVEDISTKRQIELCIIEAKRRGCAQWKIYEEELGHRSGRSERSRPAWKALRDEIAVNKHVSFVIVVDASRASRSVRDILNFIQFCRAQDVAFISIREPFFSTTEASGQLLATVQAAVNQYMVDRLSSDMKDNIRHFTRSGGKWGKVPQGLKPEGKRETRHFVASEEGYSTPDGQRRTYLQTVEAFFRVYTTRDVGGLTAARILHAEGYRWRTNKGTPAVVDARLLWQTLRYRDHYRDILPDALLDRVAIVFARRSRRRFNGRQRQSPPPLLWRLLVCSSCGRLYHTALQEGYYVYRHRGGQCPDEHGVYASKLHPQVIEFLAKHLGLAQSHRAEILRRLREPVRSRPNATSAARQRARLEKEKVELARHLAQGTISSEQYARAMQQVDAETAAMPADQPPGPSTKLTPELVDQYLDSFALLVKHLAEIDPLDANLMLRDLFQRIELTGKRITRFVPHPSTKILFARYK